MPVAGDEQDAPTIPQAASDVNPERRRRGPIPSYGIPQSFLDFEIAINHDGAPNTHRPDVTFSTAGTAVRTGGVGGGDAPPRKRGRPKGWKPGMPYSTTTSRPTSEAAKQIRAHNLAASGGSMPAATAPKPRGRIGRPPKKAPLTPRQIFSGLTPSFVPFICEWKGCKAELHNMETLRRHVHKVHGRDDKCGWRRCGRRRRLLYEDDDDDDDDGSALPPPTFLTNDELIAHIENAHLVPFEWHMGDGYRNRCGDDTARRADGGGGEEEAAPAYLFDKDGNQVTPWVKDQEIEDHATMLANRKRLRAALAQIYADLPSEEPSSDEEVPR